MGRFAPTIIMCIVLLLVFATVTGNHGLLHLQKINNELGLIEGKNRSLESELFEMENRITELKQNPLVLEKRGREELGLSRPGEIVYIFPKLEMQSATQVAPQVER